MHKTWDNLTPSEEEEYLELMDLEDAADNFRSFIKYTKPDYSFNWHHDVIVERLQDLRWQRDQRLMLWAPPRHGKSELLSRRFPAWRLGTDPNRQIMAASYNDTLASRMNRDVQSVIASRRYQEIFPDTRIPEADNASGKAERVYLGRRYSRSSSFFEVIGYKGSYFSTGVGGAATGMGADDLLIDDPIKNIEEAYSATRRDKVWDWYVTTADTRLEPGANTVILQTRWHKDDLSGRLLDSGEEWEVISFPALFRAATADPRDIRTEELEALWPERYAQEVLLARRERLGPVFFSALYDQGPVSPGGNMVKAEWFKDYDVLPQSGIWGQSWDLNFGDAKNQKTASFVVGQVWVQYGPDRFLVDQYRKKVDYVQSREAIHSMINQYPLTQVVVVEKKANGAAMISDLRDKYNILEPYSPRGDKALRFQSQAPVFKSGNVWLPRKAHWKADYIEELVSFPNAPNDDQVDATSQMLDYWHTESAAMIRPASVTATSKWGGR